VAPRESEAMIVAGLELEAGFVVCPGVGFVAPCGDLAPCYRVAATHFSEMGLQDLAMPP
jgi:hypothetical protein